MTHYLTSFVRVDWQRFAGFDSISVVIFVSCVCRKEYVFNIHVR